MRVRAAIATLLCLSLPGLAGGSEPLPPACDLMRAIDMAAPLGGAPVLDAVMQRETAAMRMSLCSATTAEGPVSLSLMLRETPGAARGDATAARDAHLAQMRSELGADLAAEPLDIGEAALWMPGVGQLTVWLRGGSVMLILSVQPMDARAAAEAVARAVVAELG